MVTPAAGRPGAVGLGIVFHVKPLKRPGIDAAAADGAVDINLVIAPSVATGTCLFITATSILKPWGLTRRGRRLWFSASSAKSVDARSPRQTA